MKKLRELEKDFTIIELGKLRKEARKEGIKYSSVKSRRKLIIEYIEIKKDLIDKKYGKKN